MAPFPDNSEDAEHTPNAKCPCGTTSVKSRRRRFRRRLSILYQKGTTSRDLIVHQSNRLHSLCILPTMMYLVASYPTDRMPVPHSEQEAISRLKLHMMLARLRSAVRAFLVKATKDDNDIWGQRLVEEVVCGNDTSFFTIVSLDLRTRLSNILAIVQSMVSESTFLTWCKTWLTCPITDTPPTRPKPLFPLR